MTDDDLLAEYGQHAAWFLAELPEITEQLPSAEPVRIAVRRFVEAGGRVATNLRSLRDDPHVLELLVDTAWHSRWAMDLITLQPHLFWNIITERDHRKIWGRGVLLDSLRQEVERFKDYQHQVNAIIRFYQYHMLRVVLGDLSEAMAFESICNEIGDIAAACIDAALAIAVDKFRERYGVASTGFVIFGLGKLGGRELNYSSDIDLIFAYGERGETSGGRKDIDHHEYFRRVGGEVIRILGEQHPGGRMYRVDMRLRPEGDAGELIHSQRELIDYYYSVGRPWERQAMIKARPVAGDRALGDAILDQLRPWIFPLDQSARGLDETRVMRRRIEERADEANVKTGAGGIRDIEFLLQFYQLAYGGRHPELRHPGSLPVLRDLIAFKLMPRRDGLELQEHYRFLRTVEHRLQMFQMRQLHEVPVDREERRELAARCGFGDRNGLRRFSIKLQRTRQRVRRLAEKHYLDSDETYDHFFALLSSQKPSAELIEGVLAPYGFSNVPQAYERLRTMASERFFVLSRSRTERNLCFLLPGLLEHLRHSPNIDTALENFQRIVDAVGGRSYFYEQLLRRPKLLRILADLSGWSNFVVKEMTRFPGLPDELADRLRTHEFEAPPGDLEQEGAELIRGLHDPAPQLAYMKAREQVLIARRDLEGADERDIWWRLTHLARSILRVVVDRCIADQAEKWGHPQRADGRPARFAILGCGKLGSSELSYASDMDIIFVAEQDGHCPENGRDAEVFWRRVTKRIVQICHDGQVYPIDARLRPWGEQGEMISSIPSLQRYWSQPRDLWERMAMTRIAPLAGNRVFGLKAARLVRDAALAQPIPSDAPDAVRQMRWRLEESVSGRDHIKRGYGGYVDVEFLVHWLSLGCDPHRLPAGAPIIDSLTALGELGLLPADAVRECRAGYLTLRRIEARMRLMEGKAISSIPIDEIKRQFFARCCDFHDRRELDVALHLAREQNRYWFDQLVR